MNTSLKDNVDGEEMVVSDLHHSQALSARHSRAALSPTALVRLELELANSREKSGR